MLRVGFLSGALPFDRPAPGGSVGFRIMFRVCVGLLVTGAVGMYQALPPSSVSSTYAC
jgi:hypothetical protein